MTKVQLAYEYEDDDGKVHAPDDVIDVDDAVAQRMIYDGKARVPDKPEKATAAKKAES
jgi:hypothetical protein